MMYDTDYYTGRFVQTATSEIHGVVFLLHSGELTASIGMIPFRKLRRAFPRR